MDITCDPENDSIYTFAGYGTIQGQKIAFEADQLLLRGSSLRNTGRIIGIAIYAGHDTKVMMNQCSAPNKTSRIEK